MTLQLNTSAFEPGGDIPIEFTCDGADVSPSLAWSGVPEGTQSFALIVEDPDAPARTWVHWVLYDLPATLDELPQGLPAQRKLPSGARQGPNDFGKIGYGGPCPPPGPAHRYYFKLYALDTMLNLAPGARRSALDRAMRGHVLASADLLGRYHRT